MDNLLSRGEIFDHQGTGQKWQLTDGIFYIRHRLMLIIRIEYDGKAQIRVRLGRTTLHHSGRIETYPQIIARSLRQYLYCSIDLLS